MKIKITQDDLINGITKAINAVSPRSTLPILSNMLIEACADGNVTIAGTDLELGIIHTLMAQEVIEEGTITVPAKKFYDIIRALPHELIEITVTKNHSVNIKSGKAFFKLMGLPKDDFPKFPSYRIEDGIEIEQRVLKECILLTSFAISSDETRYVLNGSLIIVNKKEIKVIATDGRRLAYIHKKGIAVNKAITAEVIVPTKALYEISKNLQSEGNMTLVLLEKSIVFAIDGTIIISRLIEGHFPNYEQVIPKEDTILATINRELFLDALRRVSLLTSLDAQAIKLDLLLNNKMILSARSPNLGESKEEVEVNEISGTDIAIGFNPHYLIDVLKNLHEDTIQICLSSPEKPGVIRGKEGYIYVIMPMQIG